MAKKKTGVLTKRVHELEDAVTRLFTGEGPAPSPVKRRRKKAKRATSAVVRVKRAVKKAGVKKTATKAKRRAKKK